MKNKTISGWMYFAAVLNFAASVFRVADDKFISAALFFAAAACFVYAGRVYDRKENEGR